MRWVVPIMIDRILRNDNTSVQTNGFTCIWIDVEAGEIAASNIHTNAMTLFEQVARGVEVDIKFVDFSGFH